MFVPMQDKLGGFSLIFHHWKALDFWRGVAWGVGAICMYDGADYAIKGNAAAKGPSYAALRDIPGGMHTNGIVMLILAALIFYSSKQGGTLARRVMLAVFAYSVGVVVSLVWGWALSHSIVWTTPSKWFLVGWLAILLAGTSQAYEVRLTERGASGSR